MKINPSDRLVKVFWEYLRRKSRLRGIEGRES